MLISPLLQVTKVKYIHQIQIGKYEIDAWFVYYTTCL